MANRIRNEEVVRLAMEEELDYLDLALLAEHLQADEERMVFRRDFSLDSYTMEQCVQHFRFGYDDLLHFFHLLRIPERVVTEHRVTASGMEVLCVVLKRLAYPNRYADLQEFFSRPRTELIALFYHGVDHLLNNFGDRLSSFEVPWLTVEKLLEFSVAVRNKGGHLPLCWGFIDGTVRQMCRPSQNQRLVYNGHHRVHALKFQSVVTPNGLIANLYGPMPGRRHDAALLNESGLMAHMEQHCNAPDGTPMYLYGDPAYPLRPHLQRPHRGLNLTAEQQQQNTSMSMVRESVEWQFGKVISLWAFLDFSKNLKLYLSPVGRLYRLGVLLTNCHACLYGNQTSTYFDVQPPTLEEYLR